MPKALTPITSPVGTFGTLVRRSRLAQSLTLEEVAYELDVSRQTVWNWEQGMSKPRLTRLRPLAEVFELDPDELLYALTA